MVGWRRVVWVKIQVPYAGGTALAVANSVNFLTVMELDFIHFLAMSGFHCDVQLPTMVNHWFECSVNSTCVPSNIMAC